MKIQLYDCAFMNISVLFTKKGTYASLSIEHTKVFRLKTLGVPKTIFEILIVPTKDILARWVPLPQK